MNWSQKELTLADVQFATMRQKQRIDAITRHAEQLLTDPDELVRLRSHHCLLCYYSESRLGGAAITTVNCRVCNALMQFGSTAVDVVCKSCAQTLGLCRQCGGDVRLHLRRSLNTSSIVKVAPFEPSALSPASPAVMVLPLRESK